MYSSMIDSHFSGRPLVVRSWMKSQVQTWSLCSARRRTQLLLAVPQTPLFPLSFSALSAPPDATADRSVFDSPASPRCRSIAVISDSRNADARRTKAVHPRHQPLLFLVLPRLITLRATVADPTPCRPDARDTSSSR